MLQQKIARLAADFAAQIVGLLTAAPLDELVDLASRPRRPSPVGRTTATATTTSRPKKRSAPAKSTPAQRAPVKSAKSAKSVKNAAPPSAPSPEVMTAALAFFAERGSRGATAQQLGERLAELGLAAPTDVVTVLAKSGGIRDAGFRRAAGKNATAPVFVAT